MFLAANFASIQPRRQPKFLFFCPVNNADFTDFPSDKFYDIWTQQREHFPNKILKILP